MKEQTIIKRCQKKIDKFNEAYESLCTEFGDRNLLVDDNHDFYGLSTPLALVQDENDARIYRLDCDGFLSDPIFDYDEDGELFDNTGSPYWGDGFNACIKMYKDDLRRGKRFLAMDADTIDAIQNGDIEYTDPEDSNEQD